MSEKERRIMKRNALCAGLLALALAGNIAVAEDQKAQVAGVTAAPPAGSDSGTSSVLTLADARKLALASSRTLSSLGLSADSAVIDERLQLYESLPSLSLSASASVSAPGTGGNSVADTATTGVSAGVTQTVFSGGKNAILASIDRLATSIAREKARSGYFGVLDSIDAAWYSLLEAYATVESAQSSIASCEISLEIAKARREIGAVSVSDYLEAESNAESARATLGQAKRDVAVYSMKVASLTGLTKLPEIERADFSAYEPLVASLSDSEDGTVDSIVARVKDAAYANNPDLASARLTRDKADKAVKEAAAGYLPTITAGASTGLDYTALNGLSDPQVKFSITGNVPLNGWVTKAEVDKSRIAAQQSAMSLDEAARTLDIDLATAVYGCVAEARSIVSSAKALEYAEKHYEGKLEQYKLAAASVTDLADAATLVSSNKGALIKARYAFLTSISTVRSLGAFESDEAVLAAMGGAAD
jgi:outer membrane protein